MFYQQMPSLTFLLFRGVGTSFMCWQSSLSLVLLPDCFPVLNIYKLLDDCSKWNKLMTVSQLDCKKTDPFFSTAKLRHLNMPGKWRLIIRINHNVSSP